MNIKEALNKGMIILKTKNIESSKIKARLLMQYVLKKDRQYLIVYDNKELTKNEENLFFKSIDKHINGTPIQYITNMQEFMKMNFFVNENVLIPRQDTEILVEEVIKIAKRINAIKILDLCTGSGIIGISLAKYLENVQITSVDISEKALRVAKKNSKINEVENKITFIKSDLFSKLENQKFDIIVSNPPYIRKDVIKKLDKQVQNEPTIALDGGFDGLDFYRKIIKNSYEYMKTGAYLCLEIGYDQKDDVIDLINAQDKYINTYSKKDLYDNDRIVVTKLIV